MQQMEQRLRTIELTNGQGMEQVRQTIQTSLNRMQQVQADNLAEIQGVVEQKLTQTLEQKVQSAFQMVNERLEMVYRGLGEMQTLAAGVGDLKKVLSNVKTRGILGEVQLGSILQEILAPEQYAYDVTVNPNRREHVEYAVKLPGTTNGQPVWLPIDSKFPGDTYTALRNALDSGNPQQIKAAQQTLTQVIRKCAKDIHDKYICPPYTTNFAILFLPFEGLYAEVINLGMVETLQQNFQVNIAGPSTMAAMLNALQMGFQTLAIQKRSTEVWQVLQQVQTEFDRFADVLQKTQNALHSADSQLERLVGTRTRAIQRQLGAIQTQNAHGKIIAIMITAAKLQSGGCIFLNFFRHKKRDCIKQSLRFSDFSIFLFFYLFHPTIFLSSSFRRMSSLLGLILVYHICF